MFENWAIMNSKWILSNSFNVTYSMILNGNPRSNGQIRATAKGEQLYSFNSLASLKWKNIWTNKWGWYLIAWLLFNCHKASWLTGNKIVISIEEVSVIGYVELVRLTPPSLTRECMNAYDIRCKYQLSARGRKNVIRWCFVFSLFQWYHCILFLWNLISWDRKVLRHKLNDVSDTHLERDRGPIETPRCSNSN